MDVVREGQRLDELKAQDQTKVERYGVTGDTRFRFDFPADRVAVLNGLHGFPSSIQRKLGATGWFPIVSIVPEHPLELVRRIALATPASLIKVSTDSRSRFEPTRSTTRIAPSPTRYTKPKTSEDLNVIKIFALQHIKSSEAANILTQLVPDCRFVADERVNSVIARGDGEQLQIVEALLLNLDSQPASSQQQSTPGIGPLSKAENRAKLEQMLSTLRDNFAIAEEQTRAITNAIVEEEDADVTKRLREQLTVVVAEAFNLRQELQTAELALLRERIHRIESQVSQRESLRNEIIRRRVDQLVASAALSANAPGQNNSPALDSVRPTKVYLRFERAPWRQVLEWFAGVNGVALQMNEEPSGTFSYQSSRQHTLEEARVAIEAALPTALELITNEGQLIVRQRADLLRAANVSAAGVTTLRGPSEYRQAIEELIAEIDQLGAFRYAQRQQGKSGTPTAQWDKAIVNLQKRLDLLTSECTVQVRLFELELEAAGVAVLTNEQALRRAKALYEAGRVSSAEMGKATLAYEKARVHYDQTKTLLDLYRQAGAEAGLASEIPKSKAAAEQPPVNASPDAETTDKSNRKGVSIEALTDDGVLIIRGEENTVQSVIETINQVKATSSEPAEKLEAAPRNALPE